MFITVSQLGSRFIFAVGDDPRDDRQAWIVSHEDAAILGDTPTSFASFGEAHAAGSRLVDDRPSAVLAKKASFYSKADETDTASLISAEDQVVSHYNEQVELIGQRVSGLGGVDPTDRNDVIQTILKEIEGVKEELDHLLPIIEDAANHEQSNGLVRHLDEMRKTLDQHSSAKTAAVMPGLPSMRRASVRTFAESAMMALNPVHKDVFVRVAVYDKDSRTSTAVLSNADGDIVRLSFDGNLLLSDITPCGKTASKHTEEFHRRYWEPIVNAVGHFKHAGTGMVVVTGMSQPSRNKFKAFSMSDGSQGVVEVEKRVVSGVRTWLLKKATTITTPVTSPVAVDDEVECTAKYLPSYLGRTGVVTAVNEKPGRRSYRIDFRRGLGILWLEEQNLRKVNLGS